MVLSPHPSVISECLVVATHRQVIGLFEAVELFRIIFLLSKGIVKVIMFLSNQIVCSFKETAIRNGGIIHLHIYY